MVHIKESTTVANNLPLFTINTGSMMVDHKNSPIDGHIQSVYIPNGPVVLIFQTVDGFEICLAKFIFFDGHNYIPNIHIGYGYTRNNPYKEFRTYEDVLIELLRLIQIIEFN